MSDNPYPPNNDDLSTFDESCPPAPASVNWGAKTSRLIDFNRADPIQDRIAKSSLEINMEWNFDQLYPDNDLPIIQRPADAPPPLWWFLVAYLIGLALLLLAVGAGWVG